MIPEKIVVIPSKETRFDTSLMSSFGRDVLCDTPVDLNVSIKHIELMRTAMRPLIPVGYDPYDYDRFPKGMSSACTDLAGIPALEGSVSLPAGKVLFYQQAFTRSVFHRWAEGEYNFNNSTDPFRGFDADEPDSQMPNKERLKLFRNSFRYNSFFRGYGTAMAYFWEPTLKVVLDPTGIRKFTRQVLLGIPGDEKRKHLFW